MQPEDKQLEASTGASISYREELVAGGTEVPGSEGRRKLRAAAVKAIDRGKRVAEMILECNEDGDHGDDGERDAEGAAGGDAPVAPRGAEETAFVGEDDGSSNGSLYRRKPIKTRWSAAEDAKLKQLVDIHGSGNWRVVSGGMFGIVVKGVRLGRLNVVVRLLRCARVPLLS